MFVPVQLVLGEDVLQGEAGGVVKSCRLLRFIFAIIDAMRCVLVTSESRSRCKRVGPAARDRPAEAQAGASDAKGKELQTLLNIQTNLAW